MKKSLLCIALLLTFGTLSSQKFLNVVNIDNSVTTFDLFTSEISFSPSGNLVVTQGAESPVQIAFSHGMNLRFNDSLTVVGVKNVSAILAVNCPTCDLRVASGSELTINTPKSLKSIIVAPGAKLTLISGNTLTATNGITLQSDATGTATFVDTNNSSPQAVTGTVEQYLASARNWYISSPISGATVPSGQTYYSYDETGSNTGFLSPATAYWVAVPEGTALNSIKGYIAQPVSTTTKTYTGTLNTGTQSITLSRTGIALNPGFNLVANPYPSYLDWKQVAAANTVVMPTAWFRTKKADDTYTFATINVSVPETPIIVNGGANTSITTLIPPMQAYWVRVSSLATTNFTVTNTMRNHRDAAGNLFKAPKQNTTKLVRMQVSNATTTDETVVYFNANAQNTFDNYDSPKMFNNEVSQPEIYTKAVDEKLVINGLTEVTDNLELPLGFTTSTAGNFTFKATELANFDSNTRIYLRDKQENKEVELAQATEYNFSSTTSNNNESRFSILFKAPTMTTGTVTQTDKNISVFCNSANELVLIAPVKAIYSIYNAIGQKLTDGITSSNQTIFNRLDKGFYIVKISFDGKMYSERVLKQ